MLCINRPKWDRQSNLILFSVQPREGRKEYIISPEEHVLERMVYEPLNPVNICDSDHALTIEPYRYASKDDLI